MTSLEQKIQYEFKNRDLLKQALTHKSYAYEMKTPLVHNEKLEFLGDAVLDLALGELLFVYFAEDSEGDLSKKRASLVNEDMLSQKAVVLEISQSLHLGRGEQLGGGAEKPRLLASAYEALLGALYLDASWENVKTFVHQQFHFDLLALQGEHSFEKDYKTRLQEKYQAEHREAPTYEVFHEEGPAHDRTFQVRVFFRGLVLGEALGKSKKSAEQEAARKVLQKMGEVK